MIGLSALVHGTARSRCLEYCSAKGRSFSPLSALRTRTRTMSCRRSGGGRPTISGRSERQPLPVLRYPLASSVQTTQQVLQASEEVSLASYASDARSNTKTPLATGASNAP